MPARKHKSQPPRIHRPYTAMDQVDRMRRPGQAYEVVLFIGEKETDLYCPNTGLVVYTTPTAPNKRLTLRRAYGYAKRHWLKITKKEYILGQPTAAQPE